MSTLLDKLAAEEILPAKTVLNLREYISGKHPSLSLLSKAAIFADAVNRILEDKIPSIPEDRMRQFKSILFRDTSEKALFCINGSDIFKSALSLRITEDPFVTGLGDWVERTLDMPVDKDKFIKLVNTAYLLMNQTPGIGLDSVVELAEKESSGILPEGIEVTGGHASAYRYVFQENTYAPDNGVMHDNSAPDKNLAEADTALPDSVLTTPFPEETAAGPESGMPDSVLPDSVLPDSVFPGAENKSGIFIVWTLLKDTLATKRKALRALAAVGLVGISVLLSYFSALYINATENAGLLQPGSIVTVDREELPAGAVVPADPENDGNGILKMKATAYDLSFESCGKERSHPAYGVTSSGTKATAGRTIAVDPSVIPLGSRVKITFPEKYGYLDGVYIAEDTGRLIKGNRVDVFFGEDKIGSKTINKLAMDFGVQNVEVEILEQVARSDRQ